MIQSRRIFPLLTMGCLLISFVGLQGCKQKADASIPEKPNIIFILVDDLGYGDLGAFGQTKIRTPHLDRLATEGMRFTQAYAGNAVCAPSRSCLMQGLHPGHARVRDNNISGYRESLREGDVTVAMLMKEAGYATGLFGKWGLGLHNQYGVPNVMGFDEFYGYLNQRHAHCHFPEFLYHNRERVYYPENGTHHLQEHYRGVHPYDENGICQPLGINDPAKAKYALDEYSAASLDFIRRNKDQPFFLYLAYTPPHGVFIVPEVGEYNELDWPLSHKIYAAMITRMDQKVGEVCALLEELDLDDNTLIFFASDNGNIYGNASEEDVPTPAFFDNVSPTRGGKGSSYDGGFNVPALAWWKNRIEGGQVSDHIWAFWDILPTAVELAGVEAPEGIDGISLVPVLLGETEKVKPHEFLYWEFKGAQSVRMGDWYGHMKGGESLELYHLPGDPEQENNVSGQQPDIAARILKIMQTEHSPSDVWPSPGESREAFQQRVKQMGVTEADRPENVADF